MIVQVSLKTILGFFANSVALFILCSRGGGLSSAAESVLLQKVYVSFQREV